MKVDTPTAYVNWILIDEKGQAVDTDAGEGYLLFGDPEQLACYSTLQLPRRSAMDAALHQHCTIPACLMEVDTPTAYVNWILIDEKGQAVDTDAGGGYVFFGDPKQLSCYSTLRLPRSSLMFIEIFSGAENDEAGELRRSHASADLECEPVKYLRSHRRNDKEDLFKAKLRQTNPDFGMHTVDACQGLHSKSHALLSTGRRHGIGFSSDIRRHMVSLSRSKGSTIIVAHSSVVDTNNHVGSVFQANTLS